MRNAPGVEGAGGPEGPAGTRSGHGAARERASGNSLPASVGGAGGHKRPVGGWSGRGTPRECGFTLAAVLVIMAVMAIFLTVAVQTVTFQQRREKEEELIFRGNQIVEAIRLFRARNGRFPMTLKELATAKPRVLRKIWTDPITGKVDWDPVFLGQEGLNLGGGAPPSRRRRRGSAARPGAARRWGRSSGCARRAAPTRSRSSTGAPATATGSSSSTRTARAGCDRRFPFRHHCTEEPSPRAEAARLRRP